MMNRYLLGFVLGAIAFLTLLGIGNSGEVLRRAGDASRESISANPTSAAETSNLTGIEGAGQNVLRQTSPEAIERSRNLTTGTSQPTDGSPSSNAQTQSPNGVTPPVPPSTTPPPTTQPAPLPPTDQEAIPALW